MDSKTTFALFDYENECQLGTNKVGETAFCGKCARTTSNLLFKNLNSTLDYNLVKFLALTQLLAEN